MRILCLTLISALLHLSAVDADTVQLGADQDNTLYESTTGDLSNGAGDHFFAGTTSMSAIRRGVIRFDLSPIPAGATIDDVTLILNMSRTIAGSAVVSVHRIQRDWGEGNSDASGEEGAGAPSASGDATWIHTFFSGQTWNSSGGDFDSGASDSTTVGNEGTYTWSSSAMDDEVQEWLDSPSQNFGWLLRGDEGSDTTSKRFDTRENPNGGNRPVLVVDFTPPVPVSLQSITVD